MQKYRKKISKERYKVCCVHNTITTTTSTINTTNNMYVCM